MARIQNGLRNETGMENFERPYCPISINPFQGSDIWRIPGVRIEYIIGEDQAPSKRPKISQQWNILLENQIHKGIEHVKR